jgi:hypothetical protein
MNELRRVPGLFSLWFYRGEHSKQYYGVLDSVVVVDAEVEVMNH